MLLYDERAPPAIVRGRSMKLREERHLELLKKAIHALLGYECSGTT
jgi:hypothetical protein